MRIYVHACKQRESQRIIDEFKLTDIKTVRNTTPILNEDASKFYFEVAGTALGKTWLLRAHTEVCFML